MSSSPWTCARCTLINASAALECAACGGAMKAVRRISNIPSKKRRRKTEEENQQDDVDSESSSGGGATARKPNKFVEKRRLSSPTSVRQKETTARIRLEATSSRGRVLESDDDDDVVVIEPQPPVVTAKKYKRASSDGGDDDDPFAFSPPLHSQPEVTKKKVFFAAPPSTTTSSCSTSPYHNASFSTSSSTTTSTTSNTKQFYAKLSKNGSFSAPDWDDPIVDEDSPRLTKQQATSSSSTTAASASSKLVPNNNNGKKSKDVVAAPIQNDVDDWFNDPPMPPPKQQPLRPAVKTNKQSSSSSSSLPHPPSKTPPPPSTTITIPEPKTTNDLKSLMHAKKIDELRRMLEYALSPASGAIRFFCLQGPVGCGKSTAVRVIARELGATIREWDSETLPPTTLNVSSSFKKWEGDAKNNPSSSASHDVAVQYVSQATDFIRFIRSSTYPPVSFLSSSSSSSSCSSSKTQSVGGDIVLLESLPALDRERVTEALSEVAHRMSQNDRPCAIVYVLSGDEIGPSEMTETFGASLLNMGSCFRVLHFNPIAPTRLARVLEQTGVVDKDTAALIVEEARGDARSAFSAIQFRGLSTGKKRSTTSATTTTTTLSSYRDASYSMLHGVGKLISASLDATTGRPTFVPEHVAEACGLEPDSLMSFVQENFHHYVSDIDDFSRVADLLSAADSIWGMRWRVIDRSMHHHDTGGSGSNAGEMDACGAYVNAIVSRVALAGIHQRVKPTGLVMVHKPKLFDSNRTARERMALLSKSPSVLCDRRAFVTEMLPWEALMMRSRTHVVPSFGSAGSRVLSTSHSQTMDDDDRVCLGELTYTQSLVARENATFGLVGVDGRKKNSLLNSTINGITTSTVVRATNTIEDDPIEDV